MPACPRVGLESPFLAIRSAAGLPAGAAFWEVALDRSTTFMDHLNSFVRVRNQNFFRKYFRVTGDVELEEEDVIIEEAWWFHPSVEPRVITREEFHVRSARSLRSEFYQVPVDLRLDGSFEPPGGSMDVGFSLLDILLHKVGHYVRDVPTFTWWVSTCIRVRLHGVEVISALTYFRKQNASEQNGEEVDSWAVSLWSPSLDGIGNLVAAASSGYAREIRALVSPSGVSFLQATVMETPEFWMSEGLVLELCVNHVRRLGATTRPFFRGSGIQVILVASCVRGQKIRREHGW